MTERLPKTMEKTDHRKDLCFILNSGKWCNIMKNLLKKLCPLKKVGLRCPALAIQTAGISYKQGLYEEDIYSGTHFQAFRKFSHWILSSLNEFFPASSNQTPLFGITLIDADGPSSEEILVWAWDLLDVYPQNLLSSPCHLTLNIFYAFFHNLFLKIF